MKYLVDGGRLIWVMASKPDDAARLAALDLNLCAASSPEPQVLTVYEPRSGYRFPFQLVDFSHGVNDECKANTSRL